MREQGKECQAERVFLLAVCGWPLSGKSTIAQRVASEFGVRHLDINTNVRVPIFGSPQFKSYEEFRTRDQQEMLASYDILLRAAEIFLSLGRSVILSATFSRQKYQEQLKSLCQKFPNVHTRTVWCRPMNDSEDEINRRLALRRASVELAIDQGREPYIDPVSSMERYLEVKHRFDPLDQQFLPHLKIDTSTLRTIDTAVQAILTYIRA